MKRHVFTIRGKEYPCYMTMGALRRFRRASGHEFGQEGPESPSDMVLFCHCMTASACNAEGMDFPLDAETFADCLSLDQFQAWSEGLAEDGDGAADTEKKSA